MFQSRYTNTSSTAPSWSILCILLFLFLPQTSEAFATHEHVVIGGHAVLKVNGIESLGNTTHLFFPNGNDWVTFAHVVGLGGDFYGFQKHAISDAVGTQAQMIAFNNSFNTLFLDPDTPIKPDPGYAPSKLFKYQSHQFLQGPEETIEEQIVLMKSQGKQPSDAYARCGSSLDKRFNVVSGGGSFVSDWIPFGRYIKLAETNWDHFQFGGRAWSAYSAGHTLALQKANDVYYKYKKKGRAESDVSLVVNMTLHAYALEAHALHFLTDMFSSGHMRTPRKKFPEVCSPSEIGSYLSRYQHDEECHYGLNVTNLQGDDWRAYGDNRYLDDVNAASRVIVVDCVQASVNEIIHAMENGYDSETLRSSSYAAAQCVPTPKSSEGANLTPMFKWDATKNMLLRRKELNNLWGKEFKDHGGLTGWWSSTTLLDLESLYGPPPDLPPFPNRTRLEENVYL